MHAKALKVSGMVSYYLGNQQTRLMSSPVSYGMLIAAIGASKHPALCFGVVSTPDKDSAS